VFLQINESENELSDNFGILAVEITKGRNDLNTISTNCGVPYP
jgi:Trp operon repressor